MDKERGLIAGIDLSGTRIQASVYSHNSGSVQSVKLTEDSHCLLYTSPSPRD